MKKPKPFRNTSKCSSNMMPLWEHLGPAGILQVVSRNELTNST